MSDIYADLAAFRSDPLSLFMGRGDRATEPLVPLALGPEPAYLLTDPDYVKPLLMMSEELIDKGPLYAPAKDIFGDNVLTLMGPEQRRRRAVLNTVVTRNAVTPIVALLAAEIRVSVAEAAKSHTLEGREFAAGIAMRLICLVAFGPNVLTSEDEKLLKKAAEEIQIAILDTILGSRDGADKTTLSPEQQMKQAKKDLYLIIARVCDRAPNSIGARAFGELQLSESEIVDELLVLLFSGNDTTGSAFAWLLSVFATMPELAESIAAESAAVRDENGEVDLTKLPSAKTTMATVQELLRMYPSAAWLPRGTRQDFEFAGRKLTAGINHRHPDMAISPFGTFLGCSK